MVDKITTPVTPLEEVAKINEIIDNLGTGAKTFSILDWKWSDRDVENESWLCADTFSWHNKAGYEDAYNHLVDDYDNTPYYKYPTWSQLEEPVSAVVAKDGAFYGVWYNGTTKTSSDGSTWTTIQSSALGSNDWQALANGGGIFVAIGYRGYVATSSDFVTWTTPAQILPTSPYGYWEHLIYDGSKFVAISVGGYLSTSTDGSTWTTPVQISRYLTNPAGISFTGSKYIVYEGNETYTSTDLTNWTEGTSPLPGYSFESVLLDGEKYYAFLSGSSHSWMSSSADGENWEVPEQSNLTSSSHLSNIARIGGTFVATNGTYTASYMYLGELTNETTEKVGSYTITYYKAADGHKIVTSDQETTVANIYEESGYAWYYILDKTNQRFKLPRGAHGEIKEKYRDGYSWYRVYADGWCEQGGYVVTTAVSTRVSLFKYFDRDNYSIRLTNVMSNSTAAAADVDTSQFKTNSMFYVKTANTNTNFFWEAKGYTKSDLKNSQFNHLYFYVGEYDQTATEQTAGLNASLFNGKVDLDGHNAGFVHIIETYNNGSTYYRVYSDGWCEQGGFVVRSAATNDVLFPKPFSNTSYNLQMSARHTTAGTDGRPPLIYNPTTTGFTASIYTSYEGAYWKACGYIT